MWKLNERSYSMMDGLWGRKIGMTQVFAENRSVVPVTVIDTSHWMVTQIKTKENDGYAALQVSNLRDRYCDKPFDLAWLKELTKYFIETKEILSKNDEIVSFEVGTSFDGLSLLQEGEALDIMGMTTGRGFQGCVKRHGFSGGKASHGDKVGRRPGSLSFMRSQGRVIKGKKLPGHMGVQQRMMKNLKIIKVAPESHIVLVKGSVPGRTGSLVFMRKR